MDKNLCTNESKVSKPLLGAELIKRLKRDILQNELAKDSELTERYPVLTSQVMTNYKKYERGFSLSVVLAIKEADPRLSWDWLIRGIGTPYPWGCGYEEQEEHVPVTDTALSVEKTDLAKRIDKHQAEQIVFGLKEQARLMRDLIEANEIFKSQQQRIDDMLSNLTH